jgi:hypothetical protein
MSWMGDHPAVPLQLTKLLIQHADVLVAPTTLSRILSLHIGTSTAIFCCATWISSCHSAYFLEPNRCLTFQRLARSLCLTSVSGSLATAGDRTSFHILNSPSVTNFSHTYCCHSGSVHYASCRYLTQSASSGMDAPVASDDVRSRCGDGGGGNY